MRMVRQGKNHLCNLKSKYPRKGNMIIAPVGHQPRSEQEKNIACFLFRILRWRCFSRRWVKWSKDQCQLYTYILIRSWFADFLLRYLTILWNFDEESSCKVLQFIPSLGAHCQILLWRMIFGGEKKWQIWKGWSHW